MAAINAILPVIKEVWSVLKENVMEVWGVIKPILQTLWDFVVSVFSGISESGSTQLQFLSGLFKTIFGAIGLQVKIAMELISATIQWALNLITTAFKLAFNAIKLVVLTVFEFVKTYINTVLDIISGIFKTVMALIRGDWQGAWRAIKETVMNVFNNIKTMLTNTKSIFLDAGKGFITALVDGIKSGASIIWDTMKDVTQKIRDFLPFSPAKVGPLSDLDQLDFAGPISNAIRGGVPDVQASMNSMLQVPDVNPNVTAESSGTTVIMQLDGKTIAKSTFAQMGGTFRLRGAVT
jgi:phage-related protein